MSHDRQRNKVLATALAALTLVAWTMSPATAQGGPASESENGWTLEELQAASAEIVAIRTDGIPPHVSEGILPRADLVIKPDEGLIEITFATQADADEARPILRDLNPAYVDVSEGGILRIVVGPLAKPAPDPQPPAEAPAQDVPAEPRMTG